MKPTNLGKLTNVDLRNVFAREAGDFTPWLASEENLSLLAETIGITLQCEAQEKDVGPFRADILCKDVDTDHWVLIENQVERTDHTHLGQLLTYAAGLEAVTIVWIAQRFTEEHRAALDWLNAKTEEGINFFGLEIELWKIGDSPVAPKFNIVCKPNDWTRTIQAAAKSVGTTDHKQFQLRFWVAFKAYMEKSRSAVRCQKPQPQHWMNHSIGRSGFHLCSIASTWNSVTNSRGPEIRVELVLDGDQAKQHFAILEQKKKQIEDACGTFLVWHNPEDKASCRIYARRDEDFLVEGLWPQQHEWLKQNLETFAKVFQPIVTNIDASDAKPVVVTA